MCMPARYRSAAGEEHGLLAQHDRAGCPGIAFLGEDVAAGAAGRLSQHKRHGSGRSAARRTTPVPTILTVALSTRPQRSPAWNGPCAASHRLALRYPGKRRSVAHSTGISPLRRFSPRRPPAWTWMSLLETARGRRRTTPNQDLVGKLRPAQRGLRSFG